MIARGFAALLLVVLVIPGMRQLLECVMLTHMLVQIPLLVLVGALLAVTLPESWKRRVAEWNEGGISGTLLALITSTWWMVPRALDLALASPWVELLKFVSLPLFAGAPLVLSWRQLGTIGRGFVIANVLPMWAVVGWLYIAAPVRLCNYYLVDQQVAAGFGLLAVSTLAGILTCGLAFAPAAIIGLDDSAQHGRRGQDSRRP